MWFERTKQQPGSQRVTLVRMARQVLFACKSVALLRSSVKPQPESLYNRTDQRVVGVKKNSERYRARAFENFIESNGPM